jgi:hypothetical protein
LNFELIGGAGGEQEVQHFLPSLGGLVLPELVAFASNSTLEMLNAVTWNVATEIT